VLMTGRVSDACLWTVDLASKGKVFLCGGSGP
jgi:hypothetical protein